MALSCICEHSPTGLCSRRRSFICRHVNDAIIASRPAYSAGEVLGFNRQDIASQPYGELWRDMRKLFAQELHKPEASQRASGSVTPQAVRRREVLYALESISYRAKQSTDSSVNVSRQLRDMTFNNTSQMLASKRYFGPNLESDVQSEEFSHPIEEALNLASKFEVGEYIPFLKKFDLQGNIKRMHDANAGFSRVIDKIFLEHRIGTDHRTNRVKDFADTLIDLQQKGDLPDGIIKGMIFGTGYGEVRRATEDTDQGRMRREDKDQKRALSRKRVMTEIQKELDEVVGRNRIVDESDIPNLKYLQACVKESMRLHPTFPLMLPHESTASCTIGGYYIPAQVRVFVNMAAIHWNPETYDEPEKFRPDRFLGSGPTSHLEMKGQHFDLVPFGTGRRIFMGMIMGLITVHLGGAVPLQAYNWNPPVRITPESLDISEGFGAVCHMDVPLHLVPTARLPVHVYREYQDVKELAGSLFRVFGISVSTS